MAEHWYVLHAKPHKEQCVAVHLRRRKLNAYLPLVCANPVNPRAARERPFFPGYLFVKMDLESVGVGAIQWTPGLVRLVEFGGQPASVPDAFIFDLQRRVGRIRDEGGLAYDGLERGTPVRITSGPFAGYEAVFDSRLSGTERVRVLLGLMEQVQPRRPGRDPRGCLRLELNAGSVEKARSPRNRLSWSS